MEQTIPALLDETVYELELLYPVELSEIDIVVKYQCL